MLNQLVFFRLDWFRSTGQQRAAYVGVLVLVLISGFSSWADGLMRGDLKLEAKQEQVGSWSVGFFWVLLLVLKV